MRVRSNWPGVLAVDAEVGLQRQRHVHARRDVDEGAAGPDGAVERAELVVLRRHDGAVVLLEDLGVLLERLVGAHEDHAELGELLLDRVVDDLGVVLRADAGEEGALGLRDAQLLEGVLDLVGHVIPRLLFALRGLAVVDDVVVVDLVQALGPHGHGPLEPVLVGAQPVLEHPVRLFLDGADLLDGGARQAALGFVEIDDVVVEGVFLSTILDLWLADHGASSRHRSRAGDGRRARFRGSREGGLETLPGAPGLILTYLIGIRP